MNAYSFTAGADYRVYPATITGFTGGSPDTLIDLMASVGTTGLETNDEGEAIRSASDISETVLMMAGTDNVRVRPLNTVSLFGPIRPYDFYVIGPPMAEHDSFAIAATGADVIVALVDVDSRCDAAEWKAMAGVGAFNGSFIMLNGGRNLR